MTDLPERPRRRPISKKIQQACDLLAAGKNIREAAEEVGVARETLSRALNKQWVLDFLQKRAGRTIAIAVGKAAATKVALLDSESDHCRDSAATFVLGVNNIKPVTAPAVAVNIEAPAAGYVIMLDEPRGRRTIENGVFREVFDDDNVIDLTPTNPQGQRTTP
jgi:helix-turn-helix resolvase-like protein